MSAIVRTRFAPSPTGYLHIGGARTALFSYLLARRLGGKFVLRIEDTDQTRNIEAADRKLLEDLRWLGLNWDEGPEVGGPCGPYYQSLRLEIYREHARRLLDSGQAYYAMETRAELEALRAAAIKRGEKGFRYQRPAQFPSESEAAQARQEGRPVVIRFKMPERDFVVRDQILGDVTISAAELSDFVIVKSDAWPTYNFAVVVDDAGMRITHVLRGQEHLMNTPAQLALYEAFGWTPPAFAHLPIIFNMSGTKMSKREKYYVIKKTLSDLMRAYGREDKEAEKLIIAAGAAAGGQQVLAGDVSGYTNDVVEQVSRVLGVSLPEIDIHDFRVSGYLPEVLVNFIALLGWSPGGDREKMTIEEMCELFSLERIGKTNARFDREKLLSFNTTAVATAGTERNLAGLRDYLSVNKPGPLTSLDDAMLRRLLEINQGFRLFRDIEFKSAMLFRHDEDVQYDEAAVQKWLLKGDGVGGRVLREMRAALERLPDWSPAALEQLIRGHADSTQLGLGKVAQPLRIAATGTTISPPIFDTLAILGRQRTLARIDRLLAHLASQAAPRPL